jgi:predicted phosphohydrolase
MPIYFTSDTHFGDARRIRVDKRPFASIAEHDAALIARWNEVVGPQDEIYHLGDFTAAKDPERVTALLASLNGRKHLIIGNDDGSATIENRLENVGERSGSCTRCVKLLRADRLGVVKIAHEATPLRIPRFEREVRSDVPAEKCAGWKGSNSA